MDHAATAQSARAGMASPSPEPDVVWAHPVMRLLLRVLSHLREVDRRRPWLLDASVVVLAAAAAPPDLLINRPDHQSVARPVGADLPIGVVLLIAAVLVVPLWWRRRAPAAVFAVSVPVCLVLWSLGLGPPAALVLLVALFNLALHASPWIMAWALPVSVLGWLLLVIFLVPVSPVSFLILSLGTGVAAVALGLALRVRRLYVVAVQDRAAQLEIERDQRERLSAAEERSRVAREMHDILGHNLSVMVSLADGASVLAAKDPGRTGQALALIGDTGRQAMGELRRVLEVLRESQEDTPRSPQPGIRNLEPLLERVRAAGLPVTYRTAGPVDELDSGLQLTVFRVVQEALTNTLKHAGPGATADVTVEIEQDQLCVRVTDAGTAPEPSATSRESTGHGLVGIRQRAEFYAGIATIGPRPDGHGWIVNVRLDLPASPTLGEPTP